MLQLVDCRNLLAQCQSLIWSFSAVRNGPHQFMKRLKSRGAFFSLALIKVFERANYERNRSTSKVIIDRYPQHHLSDEA